MSGYLRTGRFARPPRRQLPIGECALTYARRYAQFTLVGIAGEDDLDAPDLALQTAGPSPPADGSNGKDPAKHGGNFQRPRKGANGALSPEASVIQRDQSLAELEGLPSRTI